MASKPSRKRKTVVKAMPRGKAIKPSKPFDWYAASFSAVSVTAKRGGIGDLSKRGETGGRTADSERRVIH